MGKILVIRGGALGDFILTLPALAALRDQFPAVERHVLGYPQIARLARIGDLAHGVHPIEGRALAGFFGRRAPLDPAMQAFFAGFDLVVSYLYDPDQIFEENVRLSTKAQYLAGPHRPDDSGSLHATRCFLAPLERFAIFDADPQPRLAPPPVPPGQGPWIAVHPGSGSPTKNWPVEHWAVLLERLAADTRLGILIVGGEAEGDRLHQLAARLPPQRVRVASCRPIDEVAGLLAGCSQFIGHDSGISHLAAAVGIPTLVLWGPTRLPVWRPLGPHVTVLQADGGLPALTPERVLEALDATSSAAPKNAAPSASP